MQQKPCITTLASLKVKRGSIFLQDDDICRNSKIHVFNAHAQGDSFHSNLIPPEALKDSIFLQDDDICRNSTCRDVILFHSNFNLLRGLTRDSIFLQDGQ